MAAIINELAGNYDAGLWERKFKELEVLQRQCREVFQQEG